jgi:8-oxo-dGTP diphosphatase
MGHAPILAAGGIVVRGGGEPLIAVVRLRKGDWVLPKGKLNDKESARAAARREVLEETGHDVTVHDFLGTMSYDVAGRPKIVQFWRMQALEGPQRNPTRDVRSVQWLPLDEAIRKLTHARERVFLANVGPLALEAGEQGGAPDADTIVAPRMTGFGRVRAWFGRLRRSPKEPERVF